MPAGITAKGPYFNSEVGEGIKSLTIYEFDESKFVEVHQAIIARYVKYYGVPGLTFTVQPWGDAKESLKMLGMG